MYRTSFLLLIGISTVSLALLLSGCIKSKTVIKVKKDGSGDIVVTNIFSKECVAMFDMQMKSIKEAGGGADGNPGMKDPFYDEEKIKKDAKKYGADVQFVKAVKYDKDGCRGFVAQYSFPDVNKVRLGLKDKAFEPEMSMAPVDDGDEPDRAGSRKDSFRFNFEKGETARLRIVGPAVPDKKAEAAAPAGKAEDKAPVVPVVQTPEEKVQIQQLMANGNPLGLSGNETQEQFARKMFSGMRITMSVEVDGAEIKSNATYKVGDKGARCTLFDMDMDRLMEIPSFTRRMMAGGPGEELLGIYSSIPENPGFVIEKNKETLVEFK
ncbi:MAG TPA: hypothetical protein DET40_19255 [Lentisphaeria bacterium]|nr:MAG: hypothetical protein A2X45_18085 [Lentisphaerae bacterium GWF2_50_93]HCE45686.1 hypothetical protein [Lentisphaeria bacterium]